MPVIEHARTKAPADYDSDNHRKWEFNNSLYQKHLEIYLDAMYKHLRFTGAKQVLDAGCGEGIVYRAMRERGYIGDWTGFDNSAEAIAFCRQASPEAEWHVSSAYTLPFKNRSFELVFSSQVLEHLKGPGKPLSEFARVADKWMLLSVPYEPIFRILTWFSINLKIGGDPGHVNHWTPAGWRSFVQRVGRLHCWDRSTIYQIALVDMRGSDSTQTVESAL
ncbi:class I SAM-dependent methyltransferase [bacterium]|nr:class I SAM-dependent methyltransferase [bacterium]